MLPHYTVLKLSDLLSTHGEDVTRQILSTFYSPNNKDVDNFIKEKAIIFDEQSFAKVHLVFTQYKGTQVLVGYYALANKSFVIKAGVNKTSTAKISQSLRKRIARFAYLDKDTNQFIVTAPLIGQLGKNYNFKDLITGDILLEYACDTVREVQSLTGGKFVYLECEDKPFLIDFYTRNGFVNFGKRYLEYDEKDDLSGTYLIQMLKYLK